MSSLSDKKVLLFSQNLDEINQCNYIFFYLHHNLTPKHKRIEFFQDIKELYPFVRVLFILHQNEKTLCENYYVTGQTEDVAQFMSSYYLEDEIDHVQRLEVYERLQEQLDDLQSLYSYNPIFVGELNKLLEMFHEYLDMEKKHDSCFDLLQNQLEDLQEEVNALMKRIV